MSTEEMTIYECAELIHQIEAKAEENDGLIDEADMKAIVLAQTTSISKLTKLANYVKHLEGFVELANLEKGRLNARIETAKNRIESIKNWILPYIKEHGPIDVGLHRLSVGKSEGVVLVEGFNNSQYGEIRSEFHADKKKIKADIQRGIEVEGAHLEKREHVRIY